MYQVIGSPRTRAGRVLWALEELGAPYEIVSCPPQTPEVKAVSPIGKVPVLVDGDLAVTDSTAILLHLSDKHEALTFPLGSADRARMLSLLTFALDDLDRPLWTAARHEFVLPKELRRYDEVLPSVKHEVAQAWEVLGAFLGDGPFAQGETFTIADLVIGHLGGWAKGVGMAPPEGPVADYVSRIRARPAWRRVITAIKAA